MSEAAPLSFESPDSYREGVRSKSPKKLLKRIRECEKQIDNLKNLPYYTLFNQKAEQQKDIAAVMRKLEKLREELAVSSRSLQLSA